MIKYDPNTIHNRLGLLNEYLSLLIEMQSLSEHDYLADFRNYSTVERLLQLAIEVCIDIGNHLIARNCWGKPNNYREIFQVLTDQEVLSTDLGKKFQDIVSFRNILVHHYFKLDRKIVYSILQEDLEKFEEFAKIIISKLK